MHSIITSQYVYVALMFHRRRGKMCFYSSSVYFLYRAICRQFWEIFTVKSIYDFINIDTNCGSVLTITDIMYNAEKQEEKQNTNGSFIKLKQCNLLKFNKATTTRHWTCNILTSSN